MTWDELPLKLRLFIILMSAAALPILLSSAWNLIQNQFGSYWVVLTILAVLTVPFFLFLPSVNSIIGIGDAYIMAIAMIEGTSPCVIATFFHTVTASIFVPQRPRILIHRVVFNSASMVCGAWLYSTAYTTLNPTLSSDLDLFLLPAVTLSITFFLFNSLVTSTAISWASGNSISGFWVKNCLPLAIDFSISSVSACLIVALRSIGDYFPLAVAPFIGLVWGWNKVIKARALEAETHLREQEQLYLRTVESLAMAVDAKDQTTYGHIRRVKAYAMGLARLLDITDKDELMAIETGSLLHDIGKLAIDDYILNKPGKLSRQEFEKMKLHSAAGDEILRQIQFPFPVAKAVRHHHERWDGSGYPDGLAGIGIPIGARILAIADAYDAIRSSRPYKSSFGQQDAIELLRTKSGTIFDPRLVSLFIDNIDILEHDAELASQDMPKLSFRKFFQDVDKALSLSDNSPKSFPLSASSSAELVSLFEFCNQAAYQLDLQELLGIISRRISKLVPYSTCVLFLTTDVDLLTTAYATGEQADQLLHHKVEMGKGISGWVAAYKRPIINSAPSLEFQTHPSLCSLFNDTLVVPLLTETECLGTISLYSQATDFYNQTHLHLLETISHLVAPIIDHLKSAESQVSELIDPVTNTYRVGYLSVVSKQLFENADLSQAPLTLLLFELKGLPTLISLYGTSTAETLLATIADLLRRELRETDIIVRYGFYGFAAILPGVRSDQAIRFSTRLRHLLTSDTATLTRGNPGLLNLRLSAASYPQDGSTLFSLIKTAQRTIDLGLKSSNDLKTAGIDGNILEFPPRS